MDLDYAKEGHCDDEYIAYEEVSTMAHIQSKPVHDSGVQHKKGPKAINVQSSAPTSNNRSPQKEMKHLEAPSHELRIMGFPWLFVAVMGIIAGGVLILVLKAIGLF